MPAVKKPSLESAADVARVVSRTLKKAGFLMADTHDRFRWTEGFHVKRVGCSSLVSVDYHIHTYPGQPGHDVNSARRAEAKAKMREFLTGKGYELDHNNHIKCKRE